MNLDGLQGLVDSWIQSIGGYWDEFEIFARLIEEAGELAKVLQLKNGLRPKKVSEKEIKEKLEEEVGDILFTVVAFANSKEIDLSSAIARVMEKYQIRDGQDWEKFLKKT